MKITKIEKKKRLYLIEIDGSDNLYVTEDTIVHFMLSKGMSLDDALLKDIQSFAQFSYGKNLALFDVEADVVHSLDRSEILAQMFYAQQSFLIIHSAHLLSSFWRSDR